MQHETSILRRTLPLRFRFSEGEEIPRSVLLPPRPPPGSRYLSSGRVLTTPPADLVNMREVTFS